jgi:molecular chaperone DnaK
MTSPGDWVLAVDFGTTNTVAAVTDARGANTLMVDGRLVTPSAVFLHSDGKTWSVGETAIRTARRRLEWFEANPKRSVPDGTLFLGGHSVPVAAAITALFRPIVQEAASQHGGRPPAAFVVTHPANWGEARVGILVEAAAAAAGRNWPRPQPLSEPVAAARAILGMDDIPQQARLVVLDLGGGTVDATAVDRNGNTLNVVGQPQGREGIGGEDYDERLARWMVAEVGAPGLYDSLATSDDPDKRERAVEIRTDARNIKEQLSRHSTVPAQLPKSPPELPDITPVMVSRPELEALICGGTGHEQPGLAESVDLVDSVLASIPPGPPFIGVFLTGGGSRIPMLGVLVQERTGRPPLTYGDPATAVAQGAAHLAWNKLQEPAPPVNQQAQRDDAVPPWPGPPPRPNPPPQRRRRRRGLAVLIASLVGGGALITAIAALAANHNPTPPVVPPHTTGPTTTPPTTTAPTTSPPTTTPPQTIDFSFNGASQYPCSAEGTIHSVTGGMGVAFSFTNSSSEDLQIIWLDYSGNRETYDTLDAGDTYNIDTYVGHAWMIADSSANCLAIFGINGGGQVTITG